MRNARLKGGLFGVLFIDMQRVKITADACEEVHVRFGNGLTKTRGITDLYLVECSAFLVHGYLRHTYLFLAAQFPPR